MNHIICEWRDITCTSNGNVGKMELRDNNAVCSADGADGGVLPSMIFYKLTKLDVLDVLGNHDVTIDFVTIDFESLADRRRVVTPLSKLFMSDTNIQSIRWLEQVFPDLEALGMAGNQINGEFPSATIALLSSLWFSIMVAFFAVPHMLVWERPKGLGASVRRHV